MTAATGQAGRDRVSRGRKGTQRERLLAGVVKLANSEGYAGVNVSKIIAEAGVSRPTFYDYFADKDDCFEVALGEVHGRLLDAIKASVLAGPPRCALQASVGAIVGFAAREPAQALFLMSQAMAAGQQALDGRDAGIVEIEAVIDGATAEVPSGEMLVDLSPRILIGGLYRLLASRLRRAEPALSRTLEDLTAWLDGYSRPAADRRWRTLEPTTPKPPSDAPVYARLRAPSPLPPGRPGITREEVAANHRTRILFAAAELAEQKGYNATTIADITRLAGVDGRAFYAAFADKKDAFMAAHEIGVQQVMDATARAFFTGASWPERIWAAGRALTGFLEANPMVAHVGFVQAYAVGPGAVQRIEDSHVTFTIFLQEGYQQRPPRTPPSRLALEAIITCIFEILYLQARRDGGSRPGGMLGHISFLALAPFLGAAEADEFIVRRLESR